MYSFQAIGGARMLAHVMALSLLLETVALSQKQQRQNYEPTAPRSGLYDGSNSQHQHQQQQQPATGSENQDNLGEHVDRMSSPSGDLYWNKQQRQQPIPDLYRILLNRVGSIEHRAMPADEFSEGASLFLDVPFTNQYQLSLVEGMMRDQQQQHKPQQQDGLLIVPELAPGRTGKRQISGYPNQQIGAGQPSMEFVGGGVSGINNNYRDLVDQYKHWSPVANPSRESRAFKPKIMSTARGFGKRAQPMLVVGNAGGGGGLTRQVAYADFLVASNTDPYGGSAATLGGVDDNGKRGLRK